MHAEDRKRKGKRKEKKRKEKPIIGVKGMQKPNPFQIHPIPNERVSLTRLKIGNHSNALSQLSVGPILILDIEVVKNKGTSNNLNPADRKPGSPHRQIYESSKSAQLAKV